MDNLQLLETICSFPAVSGNEAGLTKFLYHKLKPISEKIFTDRIGNLICYKGKNFRKITVFAHVDKIGFMLSKPGNKPEAVGLSVEVENKLPHNKKIDAVINGFYISYQPNFKIKNDWVVSQGLDNALGLVAAIEWFKQIKFGSLALTVQEEMKFSGALMAAKTIKPKRALIIDTTYADDPKSAVKHGDGVSFCLKDDFFSDKTMFNKAVKICRQLKLNYQIEVLTSGDSDIVGIYQGFGWIPHLFIGIPISGMHTYQEKVLVSDWLETINFLKNFV